MRRKPPPPPPRSESAREGLRHGGGPGTIPSRMTASATVPTSSDDPVPSQQDRCHDCRVHLLTVVHPPAPDGAAGRLISSRWGPLPRLLPADVDDSLLFPRSEPPLSKTPSPLWPLTVPPSLREFLAGAEGTGHGGRRPTASPPTPRPGFQVVVVASGGPTWSRSSSPCSPGCPFFRCCPGPGATWLANLGANLPDLLVLLLVTLLSFTVYGFYRQQSSCSGGSGKVFLLRRSGRPAPCRGPRRS